MSGPCAGFLTVSELPPSSVTRYFTPAISHLAENVRNGSVVWTRHDGNLPAGKRRIAVVLDSRRPLRACGITHEMMPTARPQDRSCNIAAEMGARPAAPTIPAESTSKRVVRRPSSFPYAHVDVIQTSGARLPTAKSPTGPGARGVAEVCLQNPKARDGCWRLVILVASSLCPSS